MRTTLIITDDFYSDPDAVRAFALKQKYDVTGNFPGKRTISFLSEEMKNAINEIMGANGPVVEWGDDEYTGAFQICTALNRTWIHSDTTSKWAGVCYLTPDPPASGGTGIFRYKATGEMSGGNIYPGQDYTKWELIDRVGNLYNRLVIYRGDLYHASLDYFGSDMEDGRLFQTFFFNT